MFKSLKIKVKYKPVKERSAHQVMFSLDFCSRCYFHRLHTKTASFICKYGFFSFLLGVGGNLNGYLSFWTLMYKAVSDNDAEPNPHSLSTSFGYYWIGNFSLGSIFFLSVFFMWCLNHCLLLPLHIWKFMWIGLTCEFKYYWSPSFESWWPLILGNKHFTLL